MHCKLPLNFEFEFNLLRDHPDIKISPQKGILPGKGSVEIEITYAPSTSTTAILETELKLSQFDFEPLIIKVTGSGRHANNQKGKRPPSNIKLKSLEQQKNERKINHRF